LDEETAKTIIQLVEENKPETVKKLAELAKTRLPLPEPKIVECILQLQSEGKITFKKTLKPTPEKLGTYIRTEEAYWYWITILLAAITAITVFTIPEDAYPLVYVRYVLGAIFVLWLPGYSFIRALFPTENQTETSKHSLDTVERTALSIGLSLALVPLIGLLLNYTPWGIRLTPIVLSLLALTTTFATVAVAREHQNQTKRPL
jgi:hypothetical protein